MSWTIRVRLRERIRTNTVLIPLIFAVLGAGLGILMPRLDESISTPPQVFGESAAETLLGSIATGMITVTGIAVSMTIATLTFASGALTPRILRWWSLSQKPKVATGLFVLAFIYPLVVLSRVAPSDDPEFVPNFSVMLSIPIVLASAIALLWLVRQMGRQLRVVETLDDLAARGVEVIESVHPERFDERGGESMESPGGRDPSDSRLVRSKGPRGVVVRINEASLVEDADAAEAVVELIAAPGSFVSREEPLFRVYPAGAPLSDDRLRTGVAYSDERTLEDDPLYAVRLTVDVAVRALSAAVNDPTTAIQALDRLEELLAFAGRRRLRGGAFLGAGGRLRLIVPRPRWEDYLDTGLTEIRQSGEGQIQVARRMSALLDGLRAALPEPRHEAIDRHRRLLALSVERSFETQEERELATIADPEGLGAPRLERGPASG